MIDSELLEIKSAKSADFISGKVLIVRQLAARQNRECLHKSKVCRTNQMLPYSPDCKRDYFVPM